MTDAQLAALAAQGNSEAFWDLYRRHRTAVHGFAARVLRDPALAEDATHEAFLRAYEHVDGYEEPKGSFVSWVLAIAYHECCRLRRRSRRFVSDDVVLEREAAAPRGLDSGDRLDLERALAELPEAYRLPIVLVKLHGLEVAECAAVLGLTPTNVKQRIHRGFIRLRNDIAPAFVPSGGKE